MWIPVWEELNRVRTEDKRIFEIGCGNGATAKRLSDLGYDVVGVDPSESGIRVANKAFPGLCLYVGDAYDDLRGRYGTFSIVISLEVIEHCYRPRKLAQSVFDLLEEGGVGIISSPYRGYWKNLALAISGKFDSHVDALWDGGHIKFFSIRTLGRLLREVGFAEIRFRRVGRIPVFAKSMLAVVYK